MGLLYVDQYAFYRGYGHRITNQISPEYTNDSPLYNFSTYTLSIIFYPLHSFETKIINRYKSV
jgi:hypothetical protein